MKLHITEKKNVQQVIGHTEHFLLKSKCLVLWNAYICLHFTWNIIFSSS